MPGEGDEADGTESNCVSGLPPHLARSHFRCEMAHQAPHFSWGIFGVVFLPRIQIALSH
jgi:hypothetical protein